MQPLSTRSTILVAAALPLAALIAYGVWDQTRTYPTPRDMAEAEPLRVVFESGK